MHLSMSTCALHTRFAAARLLPCCGFTARSTLPQLRAPRHLVLIWSAIEACPLSKESPGAGPGTSWPGAGPGRPCPPPQEVTGLGLACPGSGLRLACHALSLKKSRGWPWPGIGSGLPCLLCKEVPGLGPARPGPGLGLACHVLTLKRSPGAGPGLARAGLAWAGLPSL